MDDPEEIENSRLNQMALPPTSPATGGTETEPQMEPPAREVEEKTQLLVKNDDSEVQR